MKFFLFFYFFIFPFYFSIAQDSTKRWLRSKNIIALPVAFRLPETRWGGGVGGVASFRFAKDRKDANPSQLSFGTTFTQNKQILIFFPFKIFTKNNGYYFSSENGWYRFNYLYSGVGESKVLDEKYDVDYFRFRFLASKLVRPSIYLGLRVNFENYNVTGTVSGGELSTGKINGSDYSRTSGLGLSILKDTRDMVFYPRKGMFAEFYVVSSSRIFGSNREFTKIAMDITQYKSLGKKTVWANNLFTASNIGNVPFNQLAYLGGQTKMRGIFEGYFRDKNVVLMQTEFRQEVWKVFGVVAFCSLGFLGNQKDIIRLNRPKYTYGGGLRIATKNHLNLRIDYALSPYNKGNLYLTIGEAF